VAKNLADSNLGPVALAVALADAKRAKLPFEDIEGMIEVAPNDLLAKWPK
jgi:hypothetical protein